MKSAEFLTQCDSSNAMRDTFVQTFKDKSDESGISGDNYGGDKLIKIMKVAMIRVI